MKDSKKSKPIKNRKKSILLIAQPMLKAPRLNNIIHNIFQKMSMLRSSEKPKILFVIEGDF